MQIVGYKWRRRNGTRQPQLVLADGDKIQTMWLWDASLSVEIGARKCVGFWSEAGRQPCPTSAEVSKNICDSCKAADRYLLCRECVGASCINQKVRDQCEVGEYFIYLASFGSLLKVGISRSRRFYERLIEQGADFGTKIAEVRDGLRVRAYEQEIAKWLNITDFVSGDTKATALFGDPNAASTSLFSALTRLQDSPFKFICQPEIYDLRDSYRLHNVPRQPELLEITKGFLLKGEVVATKGPAIVMRDRFRYFAINAHRLLGREIRPLVSLEEFCEPAN